MSCEDSSQTNDLIEPRKIKKILNISEEEIDLMIKNETFASSDKISPINESVIKNLKFAKKKN